MKESIRRIALSLGLVGLLAFCLVTLQQISTYCSDGQVSCLSAAVTFGVIPSAFPEVSLSTNHAAPTTAYTDTIPTMTGFLFTFVQVTSVYLILLSVIILVVLEFLELRYLRKLLALKVRKA